MRTHCLRWTLLLLLVLIRVSYSAPGSDRWTPPATETAPAQLPALSQRLVLDGDLQEWAAAACVPMRYRSYFAIVKSPDQWQGPADASMEFYAAWNPDGLCLAAIVADDEVHNDRIPDLLWQQDCIEIFLDGRAAEKFMKPPYSPGAYQLFVGPPTAEGAVVTAINKSHGTIDGLEAVGKRTATGYVVEVLVPWGAFPEFAAKPGAELAFQVTLDDYDSPDGEQIQPLMITYRGAQALFVSPQNLIEWVLVDELQTGEQVSLGPMAPLDFPAAFAGAKALPISVEVGSLLGARVGSMRITATDADGKVVFDRRVKPSPLPAPWSKSRRASLNWRAKGLADGCYTVTVVANDKAGQPLGVASRPVVFVPKIGPETLLRLAETSLPGISETEPFKAAGHLVVRDMLCRLGETNVAELSQTEPFRAAAYLGAAACLERVKRVIEIGDPGGTIRAGRELTASLDLLEDGKLEPGDWGLYDLLALTANPEVQVVVEYLPPDWLPDCAAVTFCWGAIPLVAAYVQELPTEQEALDAVEKPTTWILDAPWERPAMAGRPARMTSRLFDHTPFELYSFAAHKHILLISNSSKRAVVIDVADIDLARVDAVTILPDCPAGVRDTVEAWAQEANVPAMELEEAMDEDRVLIAGDVRTTAIADTLATFYISYARLVERAVRVTAAAGKRLIWFSSPTREVAEQVVGLIGSLQPVKLSEVDTMRRELVRSLAPKAEPASSPAGMSLFCGDLHMHTFYSDGSPSPVGLALQAMHCYLDFAAITDHNTIEGAQLAQGLFAQYGFAYPLIVGEEITMDWAHMNAYPLKELISWYLPPYEIIKAAHKQGAVIQLNHPGWPESQWAREHTEIAGFARTGLDAWEHLPDKYDDWKKAGAVPVITGTTDTHSGTFDDPERTIIVAPNAHGDDVAEAVRSGQVAAVLPRGGEFFYGPDRAISLAWAALAEGHALKAAKAEQLKNALKGADLLGLLQASQPRPIRLEQASAR